MTPRLRSGIYCILNTANGKRYIGSSANARRRIYTHTWMLRAGVHESILLQGAWDRDGEAAFVFTVIEYCAKEDLLRREQIWINVLQVADRRFGYNVCTVAGTRAGVPQPEGHAEQIRLIHKGKPKTPEQREKMRQAALRRWQDMEERAKQAARNLGHQKNDRRKLTPEQVIEIRVARSAGATYLELQKQFGRSAGTIDNVLNRIGCYR